MNIYILEQSSYKYGDLNSKQLRYFISKELRDYHYKESISLDCMNELEDFESHIDREYNNNETTYYASIDDLEKWVYVYSCYEVETEDYKAK